MRKILLLFLAVFASFFVQAQYRGGGGFGMNSHFGSHNDSYSWLLYYLNYKSKKENGENVDFYYRSHTGFSYALLNTTLTLNYIYQNDDQSAGAADYFEGSLQASAPAKLYGASAERYFPLGKLSEESTIALTIGADGLLGKVDYGEVRLNGGKRIALKYDLYQINIPIGLAYKTGSDVVFRKNVRSGFSFGGGVLPSFTASSEGNMKWSVRPYAMAEIAFVAGLCWKIRGTGYVGGTNLLGGRLDFGEMSGQEESTLGMKTKGGVMISLLFTDFSWDWDRD